MILCSEERFYDDNTVILKIIYPSEPSGGWPGNKQTLRVWSILSDGKASYVRCTDEQVEKFESEIWEVDLNSVKFIQHPTLGRVCTAKLHSERLENE